MAATLFQMDARRIADILEPDSVQCVVTSPPYWGLRDYGLEPSVWGGDPGCEHEWVSKRVYSDKITRKASSEKWSRADGTTANADALRAARWKEDTRCSKCGAWRGCLGLEPSPEQFVANIVEVFRGIRQVLRPDGTVWLNLGDSYCSGMRSEYDEDRKHPGARAGQHRRPSPVWAKPKDLLGIPWRVAFALQADGWYLRSAIVWAKGMSFCPDYSGSVMPESVRDRPTSAYEMVYLLAKSERYFYDAYAVREPLAEKSAQRYKYAFGGGKNKSLEDTGQVRTRMIGFRETPRGRNLRNVWAINPKPYPGAHFATFPEALIEPMIRAGTSPKACPSCRAPWKRVVERTGARHRREPAHQPGNAPTKVDSTGWQPARVGTNRFEPGCACKNNDGSGRCIVFDPFTGSGTTLAVADRLGRDAVGTEIKPEYVALSKKRIGSLCVVDAETAVGLA